MANGSSIMTHPLESFPITMDLVYRYFSNLNMKQPHDVMHGRDKLLSRSSRSLATPQNFEYWWNSEVEELAIQAIIDGSYL